MVTKSWPLVIVHMESVGNIDVESCSSELKLSKIKHGQIYSVRPMINNTLKGT